MTLAIITLHIRMYEWQTNQAVFILLVSDVLRHSLIVRFSWYSNDSEGCNDNNDISFNSNDDITAPWHKWQASRGGVPSAWTQQWFLHSSPIERPGQTNPLDVNVTSSSADLETQWKSYNQNSEYLHKEAVDIGALSWRSSELLPWIWIVTWIYWVWIFTWICCPKKIVIFQDAHKSTHRKYYY